MKFKIPFCSCKELEKVKEEQERKEAENRNLHRVLNDKQSYIDKELGELKEEVVEKLRHAIDFKIERDHRYWNWG